MWTSVRPWWLQLLLGANETQRVILCLVTAWIALVLISSFAATSIPTGRYGYSSGSFNARIEGADVSYYNVSGSNLADLREQVNDNSLLLPDGSQPKAATEWKLSWSETFDGTDACRVVAADVQSSMTVVLPRWTDPESGSISLNLHWKDFFDHLVRHEGTHVRLNLDGASNIRAALLRTDCHNADVNARAAYGETVRLNNLFDERTSLGLEPYFVL